MRLKQFRREFNGYIAKDDRCASKGSSGDDEECSIDTRSCAMIQHLQNVIGVDRALDLGPEIIIRPRRRREAVTSTDGATQPTAATFDTKPNGHTAEPVP